MQNVGEYTLNYEFLKETIQYIKAPMKELLQKDRLTTDASNWSYFW